MITASHPLHERPYLASRAYRQATVGVEHWAQGTVSEVLAPAVGKTTAGVLVKEIGAPRRFHSLRPYLKAYGLNLKEKSSGKHQGRLKMMKQGSGRARQYLWLAVYRWRQRDPIAQAWNESKVKRDGGGKARAVVSLMRNMAGPV